MMNRNRADGSLPISSLMTRSVSDLIDDLHAQQPPRPRIERRLPQHLRHHLAEALEARDLDLALAVRALEDVVLVLVVERPVRLLADVDAVERRLREDTPCPRVMSCGMWR